MKAYLALLRGINVGGKNIIKMTELAAFFKALGYTQVQTYIQSGNVIFCANEPSASRMERLLEASLSSAFNYTSKLVLISHPALRDVVKSRPRGFGLHPEEYRYDVIFLKAPLTSAQAIKSVSAHKDVDRVHPGPGVIYARRLIALATRSHISRLVSLPIYQDMTIRNWNTTTRLLKMMDETEV